jgi:hypothetical protein
MKYNTSMGKNYNKIWIKTVGQSFASNALTLNKESHTLLET